ncbi:MAG TPA: acyl carrier protein [Trueperaceae bacterium]|nr:acyl carrier protein [Trueperaceae bacterium]
MTLNTIDTATIDQDVRQFLADNFILDDGGTGLGADDSLTQAGVLDSMGVLELIMFVQERFGVSIPDEDTLPENLDSVSRIVNYISKRLAAEARG